MTSSNSSLSWSSMSSASSSSSSSSDSLSSQSSSMTSISSESSAWDSSWYSIVYIPAVKLDNSCYTATFQVDLRHSDSQIVDIAGPMKIDLGGEFGDTELADEVVTILDGYRVSKTFTILQDARAWQEAVVTRIRSSLHTLRSRFYSGHPGDFDLRHRRV